MVDNTRLINGRTYIDGSDIPLEGLPPMDTAPESAPPEPTPAKGKPKGKNVTADRFRVPNAFVDCALAGLTRFETGAWLILYRDTRDGTARTSMSDMGRRAGCSRRTIVRAVKRLEKLGLVKVVYRGGKERGCSRYVVKSLVTQLCHQMRNRA